jgi:hypothetical protein
LSEKTGPPTSRTVVKPRSSVAVAFRAGEEIEVALGADNITPESAG